MTGHTEKKSSPYPLPAEEGQTDTPINPHNLGEVSPMNDGGHEKSVFISRHRNKKLCFDLGVK